MPRAYLCIDLKSFYASVECVERGLDPMSAHLVVADPERSESTICLAVSPALRALGVRNRCRVFEIPKGLDYVMAPPRMRLYIDYAARIYELYLSYFSKDDIHVYSIDECFIDVTEYLATYKTCARALALRLMNELRDTVGVRATCGIGTNLYLAKVALDVLAKHTPDFLAELNEESYRERLWDHTPLTDFWRVGHGTAKRLAAYGIHTMRQLAAADEELIFRLFGVDGELLLDHARGEESTQMSDIKAYRAKQACIAQGQVLMRDYTVSEGRLIVREMLDVMCLELVDRESVATGVSLSVGFGRGMGQEGVSGAVRLSRPTSSDRRIIAETIALYDRLMRERGGVTVRRVSLCFSGVIPRTSVGVRQMSLFEDAAVDEGEERDHRRQKTVLSIQQRFGKDAILKGMNFEDAATTRERNHQIGGHKAGD